MLYDACRLDRFVRDNLRERLMLMVRAVSE